MVDTTKQVTLSTTAALVISQDNQRTGLTIMNMDTSITVYISTVPGVTSSNGYPVYPRTEIQFSPSWGDNVIVPRYMIAASGNPAVAVDEEYARG